MRHGREKLLLERTRQNAQGGLGTPERDGHALKRLQLFRERTIADLSLCSQERDKGLERAYYIPGVAYVVTFFGFFDILVYADLISSLEVSRSIAYEYLFAL